MKFHISIKFRAFGVTLGTLDQKIDGAPTLSAVVRAILPAIAKTVPAVSLFDPSTLISQIQIPAHVLYNDRGVLLEVLSA